MRDHYQPKTFQGIIASSDQLEAIVFCGLCIKKTCIDLIGAGLSVALT